jgi:hypothetical protein
MKIQICPMGVRTSKMLQMAGGVNKNIYALQEAV